MYLLTMEPEFAVLEGETFGNLETRQVDVLNNKTEGGKASAKLNAIAGKALGPSMSLSVIPGDTVKMTVHAKYDQKASTKNAITGMAAIVASAFTPEDATTEMSQLISQAMLKPLGAGQVALFAKDNSIPKAYLNYLFFDKKMTYKKGGFQQISEAAHGKFEEITLDFAPEEEGYLMVYVANQTNEPLDVFFDQMAVEHTSGPIIRVDDYYPFGMAFNTGTLAGALTNKYLYNGKELQNELGLDWYDYGARMYDAQLGRWFTPDPLAEQYYDFGPYHYVRNNPFNLIDPTGMSDEDPNCDEECQQRKKNAAEQEARQKEIDAWTTENRLAAAVQDATSDFDYQQRVNSIISGVSGSNGSTMNYQKLIDIGSQINSYAELGQELTGKYKVPGYVGTTLNVLDIGNKVANEDYSGAIYSGGMWVASLAFGPEITTGQVVYGVFTSDLVMEKAYNNAISERNYWYVLSLEHRKAGNFQRARTLENRARNAEKSAIEIYQELKRRD